MKCSDIMTKNVECCFANSPVEYIAQLMKSKNIGPVPVIDNLQNKRLVGIITDRDIVLKAVAAGRDLKTTNAQDVMTTNLSTCKQDEDVQSALNLMEQFQVRRVPIVDNNNHLVGIIAQADIATRLNAPNKTAEVVEEISKPQAKKAVI